jgi:Ca-activated chloride channel family protein
MADENRLNNAKYALAYLLDHLQPQDICSIVAYDHLASVYHESTPVIDVEQLKRKLNHIHPGGTTNISMGLQLGYKEVLSTYDPNKINRVLLLSDGIANEGITDDYLLELLVRDHSQRENITTTTFGMGHEFNEKLMHNMAEAGAGNYYFIERPQDAIIDFESEIKMLLGIVAKNGLLKIQFPSEYLKMGHVFGAPYTLTKNEIIIDLKEIHPLEQHGILIKFHTSSNVPDSLVFTTNLQYMNAMNQNPVLKTSQVIVKKLDTNQDCRDGFNADVTNKVILFSSNYYLDSAADHAERGDFTNAHSTLQSAKNMHATAAAAPGATSNDKLKQQYDLINEYQTELEKHKGSSSQQLKLLHKRMRHRNYKVRKMK